MRANMVRFAPCARTDWHSHALGQTLHIVSGTALVQARGGEIVEVHPGETIYTPAGEEHWHGAAPDRFMTHLALWEGPGGGSTETTDSGSGHTHEVDLADSTSGSAVYFAGVGTPPVGDLRTSGGGQINTSSTGSGHTHDVTVPAHTHDVTVPAHTHDVTAAISTEYGIYEDPGTAYAATDLEFSINGGAWRSDQAGISGASGWYALDITDEIVGLALRPLQVANSVAVRVKAASYADQKVQITAQIERRCVIQSIAQL